MRRYSNGNPDAVIVDGVSVFYGDFTLPDAAAIHFIQRAATTLKLEIQKLHSPRQGKPWRLCLMA